MTSETQWMRQAAVELFLSPGFRVDIGAVMKVSAPIGAAKERRVQVLRDDGTRLFCRISGDNVEGDHYAFATPSSRDERTTRANHQRLVHEFGLREDLDAAWALRPLELVRDRDPALLVVEYPGGKWLDALVGHPMNTAHFLQLAVAMAGTLGRVHGRGLVHKDVKPSNVLVNSEMNRVWLTGFGLASRLPRERQPLDAPELIAGTLAYMSPEQTGRMNRSIDSRSDLYSLGVTFYELLTGSLPFMASEPLEWVHCHIAREPVEPYKRIKTIPAAVSAITMKLLAKTAEDRYQTAAGAERDLRRCLSEWLAEGRIADFVPGESDVPDRLMIPEKLYGRTREIDALLTSFNRVVAGGGPELVLVSGYSGIGKSAVVNELHRVLVPPRGLFASGKFDQYKRDIPYSTLAQAFQGLVGKLLGKSESELLQWRHAMQTALDPNGQLIVDLVPDVKHIIGEQSPVPALPPQDALTRYQLVLRRFIGVFARAEHPLALFLDDLQWLDSATLDLLEDLFLQSDLRHLLVIGAYRDNEVSATHPLTSRVAMIREAGAAIQDIVLAPLAAHDIGTLLSDSLRCEWRRAAPLATLVHEKTTGNPFFAIQFVLTLTEEGLLVFDYDAGQWVWDLDRIRAKGYTDNVVELMMRKLSRLSGDAQKALEVLACLGHSASLDMLQVVYQSAADGVSGGLSEAEQAGLLFRSDNSYRFLHDRVQEAAYSRIPAEHRPRAHLRIGRLLATRTPPDKQNEGVFEIVNQLNRGAQLMTSSAEREHLAVLNLTAGKRAKASTAYASALRYLRTGRMLLAEDSWQSNYELIFALECLIAECELLTAQLGAAERHLGELSRRANTNHDIAIVTRLQLTLYTTLDRSERAIEIFLDYLRLGGTDWPLHPSLDDVKAEYARIWDLVGGRQIEDLVDLPIASHSDVLDMLDVFTEIVHPALFYDENLSSLVVCRMVNLSLEHGNSDGSCFGYVWFAMFAGPRFNSYRDGFRFGQLGYDLVEKRGLTRYQARTYISFGTLTPWAKHALRGRELVRRAFDVAQRIGDLTFSAYSWHELITNYLAVGDPLAEVQTEAEKGLAFAKNAGFGLVVDNCAAQLALIRTLRGLTPRFGCLDHGEYDESECERHLASNPTLALAEFFYWTRKLQARYFAGDFGSAVEASRTAHRLLWTAPSQLETGDFRFFAALAHAAAWDSAPAGEKPRHFDALIGHHRQLVTWATHSPENFDGRATLAGAEIARIQGQLLDAEQLYEAAIRSAHANGLTHIEAVATECAAHFYASRGFERVADTYLRDALFCYVRWGADGKVTQLEKLHPQLAAEGLGRAGPFANPGSTISASIDHLDLATVIKVSQAVSGQILLGKLIDTLMQAAIEHAGADRGLLILRRGTEYLVEAEATTSVQGVEVNLRRASVTDADLPPTVFQYVVRTSEIVLINDASGENPFPSDEYVRQRHARSMLCLPLLQQAKLLGVLYLENSLAAHAFTTARMAVLQLLASQAATSLENTRLYGELQEREARVRRLFDSNIIGIFTWNLDGRILDANEAFLKIIGYDDDDLNSGRMRWKDLMPTDWIQEDDELLADLQVSGATPPFEAEYFRKDGARVPVLIGAATFDATPTEGVSFVLDLSDRNRAEALARESERRYHETRVELAHANRIATVGELSASIAHEVNQPLAGIVTNASTCLRMLAADPPDVRGALLTVHRTIRDANRASEVISRLRGLFGKKSAATEPLDMNEVTREVLALSLGELQKNGVLLRSELAEDLPLVTGNRVQLQQVISNLIVNASDAMKGVADRPKEIVITTRRAAEGEVRVSVRDTGVGFEPQQMSRLFEPFYTTKDHGMGLGLSISHSIIEAHHGRLWAAPNSGPGACFSFSVPREPQD